MHQTRTTIFLSLLLALTLDSATSGINTERTTLWPSLISEAARPFGTDNVIVSGLRIQRHHRTEDKVRVKFYERNVYEVAKLKWNLFLKSSRSTVRLQIRGRSATQHQGTGFIVGRRWVLTNYHVLMYKKRNCFETEFVTESIAVQAPFYCQEATVCFRHLDYCLLKSDREFPKSLPSVSFNNQHLTSNLENRYFMVGNSFGMGLQASEGQGLQRRSRYDRRCRRKLRKGKRLPSYCQFLKHGVMHFAAGFPGSSGSPLFNGKGEVIAINTYQSQEKFGPEAYNMAIPIAPILEHLSSQGFTLLGAKK